MFVVSSKNVSVISSDGCSVTSQSLMMKRLRFFFWGPLLKKVPSIKLWIGDSVVRRTSYAKNLEFLFDSEMNMHKFVHQKVHAAKYYLRSIARCCRYLTLDATKALVHAYVTSRLDYCNSLLLGLAKKSINKL